MNKPVATAIAADSVTGRTLLALRAGPMTNGELYERFPSGHQASTLARAGLVEACDDGWRLTDAGRAACPLRNPAAATTTPPSATPLVRSTAPIGLPARTAPQTHVHRPPEKPIRTGGIRMPNPARTSNPTAVDQLRRLLIEAPDGVARKDLIKRTGLTPHAVDNAIINLITRGEAVRKSYGVIAAVPAGVDVMAARLAQSDAIAAVADAQSSEAPVENTAPASLPAASIMPKDAAALLPVIADKSPSGAEFAIYDDGRLAISEGDELFVLPPDAARRLGQFLGRIEIGGWPAHL